MKRVIQRNKLLLLEPSVVAIQTLGSIDRFFSALASTQAPSIELALKRWFMFRVRVYFWSRIPLGGVRQGGGGEEVEVDYDETSSGLEKFCCNIIFIKQIKSLVTNHRTNKGQHID